ncbi:hypothetical protein HPB47_001511 [Ixodes persulcatus]|uniref:Uncharacterized protein n=1 Tax=Ixodes persulcatus TaxID=34615 RepID=A0AC60PQ41_IXOPE|nr:hypothetical protein HPB47_001511 [Ixodes persulcatus]
MDIDRVNSHEWQTVGTAPRQPHTTAITVKLSENINLGSVDTHMLGADVLHAAGLNTIERKDTYIKVRTIQNLLAIDTYRPSAETKLLALKTVHIQGKQHEIRTYKANDPANARGVVHGIPATFSEEEIRNTLEVEHAKLLHLRRIGTSNTIPDTVEGPRLPRYAFMNRVAIRLHPYQPPSILCTICCVIGHRADVCPNKTQFTTCLNCSKHFPVGQTPATPHECEPHCVNCGEDHPPTSPHCAARLQANQAAQTQALQKRRHQLQYLAPLNYQAWPDLPTHNRFEALQTSQRSRSRSRTRDETSRELSNKPPKTTPPPKTPNPKLPGSAQRTTIPPTNVSEPALQGPPFSSPIVPPPNVSKSVPLHPSYTQTPQHSQPHSSLTAASSPIEEKLDALVTKVDKLVNAISALQSTTQQMQQANQRRDALIEQIIEHNKHLATRLDHEAATILKLEQAINALELPRKRQTRSSQAETSHGAAKIDTDMNQDV